MQLSSLAQWVKDFPSTPKMPVLFVGHGNPMNAIAENDFTNTFRKVGSELPTPSLILVISAHWETRGTQVTTAARPKTIHDFGGFPPELYQEQYPAPGSPQWAETLIHGLPEVEGNALWGLDHGAWTVLKFLFPEANVPVVELSLDRGKGPAAHYELGRELALLREKGVLIVGSGNLVHNLGAVDWRRVNEMGAGYSWAFSAQATFNQALMEGNDRALVNYGKMGAEVAQAIPTPEHYLPVLYTLGARSSADQPVLFNDVLLGGSLSMTSVMWS